MTLKEKIWDCLPHHPGATDEELARRFHVQHQAANKACRELEAQGMLVRKKNPRKKDCIGNYPANPEYTVLLSWDNDEGVWTATSENLPGLVLEGGSADALMERVRYAAPELLELNGLPSGGIIRFSMERAVKLTT